LVNFITRNNANICVRFHPRFANELARIRLLIIVIAAGRHVPLFGGTSPKEIASNVKTNPND
jgi:hypothetical protein